MLLTAPQELGPFSFCTFPFLLDARAKVSVCLTALSVLLGGSEKNDAGRAIEMIPKHRFSLGQQYSCHTYIEACCLALGLQSNLLHMEARFHMVRLLKPLSLSWLHDCDQESHHQATSQCSFVS